MNDTYTYTMNPSALDTDEQVDYEKLVAFVEGLDVVLHIGRGSRPLVDKNGDLVVELVLIGVKELLECNATKEIHAYLGSQVILVVILFKLFFVC